jgi:hypothetical protein
MKDETVSQALKLADEIQDLMEQREDGIYINATRKQVRQLRRLAIVMSRLYGPIPAVDFGEYDD